MVENVNNKKIINANVGFSLCKPQTNGEIRLFNYSPVADMFVDLNNTKNKPSLNNDNNAKKMTAAKQEVSKIIINDNARDKNTKYSPVQISEMIVELSDKYNMDYKLVTSVIKKETHFKQEEYGKNGKGLMQLTSMPIKDLYQRPDIYDDRANAIRTKYKKPEDLMKAIKEDPKLNIEVGIIFLKYHLSETKGNYKKALARYNGSHLKEAYANKIMDYYKTDYKA